MATKKSTKKKARPVDSVAVLNLYSQAVRDDLTHQELIELMVTTWRAKGMDTHEKAQARLNRLNSFLRTEFDGAELQVLRGAPRMPKTTKRLRQLFADALVKVEKKRKPRPLARAAITTGRFSDAVNTQGE